MPSPPAKPVSEPSDPTIRWHGRTIATGFFPFAAPIARVAVGRPMLAAWVAYDAVLPYFTFASAFQAATWNSVP